MSASCNTNAFIQYDELFRMAEHELRQTPDALQAVVLLSVDGHQVIAPMYDTDNDEAFVQAVAEQYDRVVDDLKALGNPVVSCVLTLFRDNVPELPSFDLRKALIALNPENTQAMILLGPSVGRTIGSTMA